MSAPRAIRHGRVSLALHALRDGPGRPLLCLHALGGAARDFAPLAAAWPGPVHALDFSGHGASGRVRGGAYSPELLAGDADAALGALGSASLVGAGLGAFVALLLAGARPDSVAAALLLPGVGLAGGGGAPDPDRALVDPFEVGLRPGAGGADCDPLAGQLALDLRPPDYAVAFAARARRLLLAPIGGEEPPWWRAAAAGARSERIAARTPAEAIAALAAV